MQGRVIDRTGVGPLRLETVEVGEETLRAVPSTRPLPPGDPSRRFLAADGAAVYEGEPIRSGVSLPFVVATAVALLVALSTAVAAVRLLRRGLRDLADVIFGQRDPASQTIGWVPGGGTHGSGTGQVPPYVPYNPDWDPKNRIR